MPRHLLESYGGAGVPGGSLDLGYAYFVEHRRSVFSDVLADSRIPYTTLEPSHIPM